MQNLFKNIVCLTILVLGAYTVSGQVSKFDKVEKAKRTIFNYPPNVNTGDLKKSRKVRVIYSDREGNVSYSDAYAQKKQSVQKLAQAFYIIGEKNNAYELVIADRRTLGKPKGLLAILMGGKYRFSDPKAPEYVGWIPKTNLFKYNHSLLDPSNNRPLKYKVGVDATSAIFKLDSYFNKDTVALYKTPMMVNKIKENLKANQVVYPYKYDKEGKAVLVSNFPEIKTDEFSQIFGWVSADLLIPVQHEKVYKWKESKPIVLISDRDTVSLAKTEIDSKYIYKTDSPSDVILPVYIWDHRKDILINVKGNDLPYSEITKIQEGQKTKNIHLIVAKENVLELKSYISSFQNVWLTLEKYKHSQSNFSFASVGKGNNYYFQKTPSFSEWLDYLQKISTGKIPPSKDFRTVKLEDVIYKLLTGKGHKDFEDNIFLIFGTTKGMLFKNKPELTELLAKHSSQLLFVQITSSEENTYQDFILDAKNILDDTGKEYNNFIENYMVDNSLVVQNNSAINLVSENDNIYIYNAPKQSLYNGGIVFPKIDTYTLPASIDMALDSLLQFTQNTNEMLIQSLQNYEKKLGILRSEPSREIKRLLLDRDENAEKIARNTSNDVLYVKYRADSLPSSELVSGILFTEDELVELIENYRSLLPRFASLNLNKKERKVLKKLYKKQKRSINAAYHKKVLRMRNTIGQLFYYKTGLTLYNQAISAVKMRKIPRRTKNFYNEEKAYFDLLKKIDTLEKLLHEKKLEQNKNGEYFIPEKYLL